MPPVSTEGVRSSDSGDEIFDGEGEGPEVISVNDGAPTILNLPAGAGDVIIFSESMCHGARAWEEDYPRFTLFNRFRCAKSLCLSLLPSSSASAAKTLTCTCPLVIC